MPKTFDGIQALQFLKLGYAVRCCLWEPYVHIRWDKKSNKILNARGDAWSHGAEGLLTEVLWEFYCNPAAEGIEVNESKPELPTPGTWEWAKAAMKQGKKVRMASWGWDDAHLEMVAGGIVTHLGQDYGFWKTHEADLATDWEVVMDGDPILGTQNQKPTPCAEA